jgi:TolB protein
MAKGTYPKIALLFLIIASLACSHLLPKSAALFPSGKIIYQSDEFGNFEILSIEVNSQRIVRLTNNSANDVSPAYIPALNQIGFISDRNSRAGLYTMDPYGQNLKEVISNPDTGIDYPAWSPDGKFIAASVAEDCKAPKTDCFYDIYTMSADGKNLTNLTNTSASEWVPDWSPDGQKIAFASDRDGDSEIYVMDKNGSNLKKLTDNHGYDSRPRWSPDGKKISFETDRDGGDWDIYIMNSDGSSPAAITTNATNDFYQSWSPDGNWLVYVSNINGNNELFIIGINGQNQFRLTNNSNNDIAPVWLP